MKYKVGDRVRIKSLDWYKREKNPSGDIKTGDTFFRDFMLRFCGSVVTIESVALVANLMCYRIKEDGGHYCWVDEMIEGIVEDTTIKIKDLRKFINQMEIEGLNDETVLTFETKRSSGCIENITTMEYSPTTNILIFS